MHKWEVRNVWLLRDRWLILTESFLSHRTFLQPPRCPVLLNALGQFHQNGSLHSFFSPFIQVLSVLCLTHSLSLNTPPAECNESHTGPDHLPAPNGPPGKAVLRAISQAWPEGQHRLPWAEFSSVKPNLPVSPMGRDVCIKTKAKRPCPYHRSWRSLSTGDHRLNPDKSVQLLRALRCSLVFPVVKIFLSKEWALCENEFPTPKKKKKMFC